MMQRILLIDDHPVVQTGCRVLLHPRPGTELIEARTGTDGVRLARELQPDLVILDLALPDMNGLKAAALLREVSPASKILVFSMHSDPVFAAQAMEAGARGYVSKNDGPEVLLAAIDAVLRGEIYLSHATAQRLALMEIRAGDSPLRTLTPRERDVLRLFGGGKSLGEISADLQISYRTVANTVSHIKRKLNVGTNSKLMRIALDYAKPGPPVNE